MTETKPKRKYNYTKKTGRPSSYRPRYCQMIIKFFEDHELMAERIKATGDNGYEQTERIANEYPTIADFARKIRVNRSSILAWAETYPEFSKALKEAKDLQHEIIIKGGLMGVFNASFSIFAMKNIAGWRDKTEVEVNMNVTLANRIQESRRKVFQSTSSDN